MSTGRHSFLRRKFSLAAASPSGDIRAGARTSGRRPCVPKIRHSPATAPNNARPARASPEGAYLYPDVIVVCEDDATRIRDRGTNLVRVVEVLSPSSKRRHRVGKFTPYRRDNDDWVYRQASGPDAICRLEQLAVDIPLASIYRKITFPDL